MELSRAIGLGRHKHIVVKPLGKLPTGMKKEEVTLD